MKTILYSADLMMLSFMIISLPSLEAPKNIFLLSYLITRAISEVIQFREGVRLWSSWDNLFAIIVFTALLSTVFAGFPGLEEWKGFKVFLTAILTGWLLSRANYFKKQYLVISKLIVLSTLPPLAWGLYEFLFAHSKQSLEIHSVGHVNHSAIYLTMVFGASLAWFLSQLDFKEKVSSLKWISIILAILCLIFFIGLIIGESRGALGVAIFIGLSLFILMSKKKSITILGITTIFSILLFATLMSTNIVQKQIRNQENRNVLAFRDLVWNVSLEASRFYPALGIGMSNWHFITLEQLKKSVEARNERFNPHNYRFPGHSHNLYLTALVERGIIGLIVTFLFMIAWAKKLIQTFQWAKKSKDASFLWGGSVSAWIATFGIGLVNTTFHHEHGILACLFLGLYLSYTRLFFKQK